MTGEGVVQSVSGNQAVVRISKSSACGHDCASCGACSNPTYDVTVLNPISAGVGDRVVIESDTSRILGLSLVLYMLPVFMLIAGAVICREYSLGYLSIGLFLVFGILWFGIIRHVNKKAKIKNTIVEISEPYKD